MKKKLLGITLVIGLAAILFTSCDQRGEPVDRDKGNDKHGILLWSDIDQAKWGKIKDVLKAEPKTPGASKRSKLFRLRKYNPPNDPIDEEKGELDEAFLVYDVEALDKDAAAHGFKGHAIQIGLGAIEDFQEVDSRKSGPPMPTPTPSPTPKEGSPNGGTKMPQAHFRQNIQESQKMVDEINGILHPPPESGGSPH